MQNVRRPHNKGRLRLGLRKSRKSSLDTCTFQHNEKKWETQEKIAKINTIELSPSLEAMLFLSELLDERLSREGIIVLFRGSSDPADTEVLLYVKLRRRGCNGDVTTHTHTRYTHKVCARVRAPPPFFSSTNVDTVNRCSRSAQGH